MRWVAHYINRFQKEPEALSRLHYSEGVQPLEEHGQTTISTLDEATRFKNKRSASRTDRAHSPKKRLPIRQLTLMAKHSHPAAERPESRDRAYISGDSW